MEADAQKKVFQALKKKESLLCHFTLKADIHSDKVAICGGEVQVLIDCCPDKQKKSFKSHAVLLAADFGRISEFF